MFVDNCSALSESSKLSNIKFVFFPPNTTECNQPLDGGVIKTFKDYYRKSMVKHLLSVINSGNQIESNTITLLEAVFMLHSAWDEINDTTIQNCFRKCGFNINCVENDIQVDDEFEAIWNTASEELDLDFGFDEFVECDDYLTVIENPTEESIAQELIDKRTKDSQDLNNDSGESDLEVCKTIEPEFSRPSVLELTKVVSTLRRFFIECDTDEPQVLDHLNEINNKIFEYKFKSVKQSKITDYFNN